MKKIKILKENLSYIAGFFDGEGCISFCNWYQGYISYSPVINIANTDLKVMKWLISLLNNISTVKRNLRIQKGNLKNKESYSVNIEKIEDIIIFLEYIFPYLKVKKERAELMIKYCKSRRNTLKQHSYTEKEIIKKVIELNKRGPKLK